MHVLTKEIDIVPREVFRAEDFKGRGIRANVSMPRRIAKKLLYIILFGAAILGFYTFVSGVTDSNKRNEMWKGLVNNMNIDLGMGRQDSALEPNKVVKPLTKIRHPVAKPGLLAPQLVQGKSERKDDHENDNEKGERIYNEEKRVDDSNVDNKKDDLFITDEIGEVVGEKLFPFGMSKDDIKKYRHKIGKHLPNDKNDNVDKGDDDNGKDADGDADEDADEDNGDQGEGKDVSNNNQVESRDGNGEDMNHQVEIKDRPQPDGVVRDEDQQVIQHNLAPLGVQRAGVAFKRGVDLRKLHHSIGSFHYPTKPPNKTPVRPDAAFFDELGNVKTKADGAVDSFAQFQERMGLRNPFKKSRVQMRNFRQRPKPLRPFGSNGVNPALDNSDKEEQKPKDAFDDILDNDKEWRDQRAPDGDVTEQKQHGAKAQHWNDKNLNGNDKVMPIKRDRFAEVWKKQQENENQRQMGGGNDGIQDGAPNDRNQFMGNHRIYNHGDGNESPRQQFQNLNGNNVPPKKDLFDEVWRKQNEADNPDGMGSGNGGVPPVPQNDGNLQMGNQRNAGVDGNRQQWPNQIMQPNRWGANMQGGSRLRMGGLHSGPGQIGSQNSREDHGNQNNIGDQGQRFLGQEFINKLKHKNVANDLQNPKRIEDIVKPKDKLPLLVEDLNSPIDFEANCILFQFPSGEGSLCIHPATEADYRVQPGELGTWEPGAMKQFAEILKSDTSMGVIDVGAGIGPYTIAAAMFGRRVVAVEPLSANYRLLHKSAQENKVTNQITMVKQALDNESYTGHMLYSYGSSGYSRVKIERILRPYDTLKDPQNNVEVTTLDRLLPVVQFRKALLKIDVGGLMEANIMESGSQLLNAVHISFIMTHWNNELSFDKKVELVSKMAALKYKPKERWNGPYLEAKKLNTAMDVIIWQKQD